MGDCYTAKDMAIFLKRKGYIWRGEVLDEHRVPHRVSTKYLHAKTQPVILLILYKNNKQYLQYINVHDLTFKMLYLTYKSQVSPKLAEEGVRYSKYVLDQDFSSEWADFLARRHALTENL